MEFRVSQSEAQPRDWRAWHGGLRALSGLLLSAVADFNGDGLPDIAVIAA
jgi:hypothetical protein